MTTKYYVYVLKLDKKVSNFKKLRLRNPLYLKRNGCVYVGQSIRQPSLRFEQHKEGYKSNQYARKYGIKLLPELYEKYNSIPMREDAEDIEKMLSGQLRKQGIGVWFN